MRLFKILLILIGCSFIYSAAYAANAPPGLQKKGIMTVPSFLGKTPPGWDKGLKKGWDKNRDWRWNKKSNLWENKSWRWDNNTKAWRRSRAWH